MAEKERKQKTIRQNFGASKTQKRVQHDEYKNKEGNVIIELYRMEDTQEIDETIEKIKAGKAPRQDNITPEIIKYMGEEGVRKLTELLNDRL